MLRPPENRWTRLALALCAVAAVAGLAVAVASLPPARTAPRPAPAVASSKASPAPARAASALGTAALEGLVFDDYGRPIEGATVEALRAGEAALERVATASSDAAGAFQLRGLAAGSYEVRARKPGYSDAALTEIAAPSAQPARLTLERTGVLRGRVLQGDGSPAPKAQVTLRGTGSAAPPTTSTAEDGTFELGPLAAGVYGLEASLHTPLAELVAEPAEGIEIAPGAEAWATLELTSAASLRGAITDRATGRPIPAATVTPDTDGLGRPPAAITVDIEGRFSVAGLRGGITRILAQAPGYVPRSELGIAGGNPIAVQLDRAASLSGQVVDEAGAPVRDAELEVLAEGSESPVRDSSLAVATGENLGVTAGPVPKIPLTGGAFPLSFSGSGGGAGAGFAPVRSAADGSFRIAAVAPGKLFVVARHPAFTPGQSALVEVEAGAERTGITVALGSGALVRGEVLDAEELPASGIAIELVLHQGETDLKLSTVSDRDGRFELGPARGSGTIRARPLGEPPVEAEVVVEGPEDAEVVLRLKGEAARITGEIAGASGEPLVAAVVRVRAEGVPPPILRTAVTDANGAFELGGLPKTPVRLEIEHPDHVPLALDVMPGEAPLQLQLASGARLHATVVDRDSQAPVAGAVVSVHSALGRRGRVLGRGRTDRQGNVEIRSLNPENYFVFVDAKGYSQGRFEAPLEAGSEPTELGSLELVATASASGQVVDRYGATVPDAEVAEGDPPRWGEAVRSGKDGVFRLKGLPAGELRLTARARTGDESEPVDARALAGEEASELVLRLPTTAAEQEEEEPAEDHASDAAREAGIEVEPDPAEQPEREPRSKPGDSQGVAVALGYAAGQVRITRVLSGAAKAAGLREGDALTAVDGETVLAVSQARGLLRGTSGLMATLELMRDGARRTVRVRRERFKAAP